MGVAMTSASHRHGPLAAPFTLNRTSEPRCMPPSHATGVVRDQAQAKRRRLRQRLITSAPGRTRSR